MSDLSNSGQVSATPEGGPLAAGVPAQGPGEGQVRSTPEGGPLSENEVLVPPTWREHMTGPILDMETSPPAPPTGEARTQAPPTPIDRQEPPARDAAAEEELRKWPPYSGKPVSEVRWQEAARYAAPVVSQAGKLAIQAIGLTGRGLTRLAGYLEARRQEREEEHIRDRESPR